MSNRHFSLLAALVFALGFLTVTPPAHAVGYWNLPGTYCQYLGYGNGPGHHVPIVLGPPCCDGWLGQGVPPLALRPDARANGVWCLPKLLRTNDGTAIPIHVAAVNSNVDAR